MPPPQSALPHLLPLFQSMDHPRFPPLPSLSLALLLIAIVLIATSATGEDQRHEKCETDLQAWAAQALDELTPVSEGDKTELKELLFFLHIPRTGGRTYHHCLMRHLYPPQQHCDRSYDLLRFNSSDHCRLLATHDDYSVLMKLPKQITSVVTNVRHPVDRVFSTYEFSIEVAARFLSRTVSSQPRKQRLRSRITGPSTLNIWPWKFLVPWMREDLFSRRDARRLESITTSSVHDPYDAGSFVMPLHEFIHQPIALDLVHNGATFQVAGLTNSSYIKEAGDLRKCVIEYRELGNYVLSVAKRRLDMMLSVGLTEKHKDSATLFAHVVGGQVYSREQFSKESSELTLDSESSPNELIAENPDLERTFLHKSAETVPQQESIVETNGVSTSSEEVPKLWKPLTVNELITMYTNCAGALQGTQLTRRSNSLRSIASVNFSNEARSRVPKRVLADILHLNNLDVELHKYAQELFSKQQSLSHSQSNSLGSLEDTAFLQLLPDESPYWHYSAWSGSRKMVFFMMVSVIAGVGTIGVGFFVFMSGGRSQKFRTGYYNVSHEKI